MSEENKGYTHPNDASWHMPNAPGGAPLQTGAFGHAPGHAAQTTSQFGEPIPVPPSAETPQQAYTPVPTTTPPQAYAQAPASTEPQYAHVSQATAPQAGEYQAPYQQEHSYYQTQPMHAAAPPPKKQGGKGLTFLVGLLGVLVGACLSVGILYVATSGFSFSGTVDTSNIVIEPTGEDTELAEAVAAKVTPSVVNIDVYAAQATNPLEDFFGNGGSSEDSSSSTEKTGLGSGVILTSDGYIITNYHVIEGSDRLLVSIDDEQYEASIVGSDPSSDLAVIKVEASGLTPIEIGSSEDVSVGEWVMAVGSPFGLEKSVSTGIVSALYRSTAMQSQSGITIYANLIQTDAAINPGNSGGALVNSLGELIGINTLINSTSGSSAGIGFAIPVDYAFSVAEQLMNGNGVAHPFLGVTLYSVDASVAEQLGVSVDNGAYIESVQAGSPAEQAGLQPGDVITSVNSKQINTSAELIIEIRGREIGSAVNLGVNRAGTDIEVSVVLGSTTSQ